MFFSCLVILTVLSWFNFKIAVQGFTSLSLISSQWMHRQYRTTRREHFISLFPYQNDKVRFHDIEESRSAAASGDSKSKSDPSDTITEKEVSDEKYPCHRRHLCIITESNACDTMQEVQRTFETLRSALGTHNDFGIDMISIRVNPPSNQLGQKPNSFIRQNEEFHQRLVYLASQIMNLKRKHQEHPFYNEYRVVINDINNLQAAIEANVDGVHVKEKDAVQIPYIRSVFQGMNPTRHVTIGISAHSASVALHHFEMYQPNYIFVGTCYLTQSHPEKGVEDLEGPELPGLVKQLIFQHMTSKHNDTEIDRISPPIIFAIGGIEMNNCHEPVAHGADGVAVIRSVMQSSDPARAVQEIIQCMYGIASNSKE
eukprot:CAMPEP_0176500918 /NCGR_PEP_ID=MMETSP0200_2-20121128/13854_1 /TAXON_ID=947934 /ORGANISM="Chaetoceros sp., Strain GSL56" /LENGTH=369 /DNA_ID=CAMNT_0017899711 /DNA_START=321 /DNA_END=1430 /DNA_ORIENTATION=-